MRLGSARYLGQQGRLDPLLVLYGDGTEGTVSATQRRSVMMDRKEKPPRARPMTKVTWAPGGGVLKEVHPGNVPAVLAGAMPGTHAAAKKRVLHQDRRCVLEAVRMTSSQWSQLSSSVASKGLLFSSVREAAGVRVALAAQAGQRGAACATASLRCSRAGLPSAASA